MANLQTISGHLDLMISDEVFERVPALKFDHVETIRGGSRWKMSFRSVAFDTFADLADSKESERDNFQYRFKMDGDIVTQGIEGQGVEWYRGVIVKSKQILTATGVRVFLTGTDPSILMQGRTRTQPWRVSFPSLAREIARTYGISNVAIEPPVESEPPIYWQYGENDWNFLDRTRKNLVASPNSALFPSSGGSGRGDYEMWFTEGGVLNIKPPGREGRAEKPWLLSQGGLDWRVKSLKVVQRKRALQAEGGLAIMGIGFNPLTKEALTFEQTPATSTEKPKLAKRLTLEPTADIPALTMRSVSDTLEDLERDVKSEYGNRFRRMYVIEAEVMPEFRGYNVGDVVTIDMVDPRGTVHPVIPGNYIIEGRRTIIVGSNIRMKLLLARHGAASGTTGVVGRPYDQPSVKRNQDGRIRQVSGTVL